MNTAKRTIRRVATFVAVAAAILQLRCAPQAQPPPSTIPTVTVAHPVKQEVIEWDDYTGHLDAVDFVEVRARVSGLVMSTPFQAGSIVKEGDLLVEIDVRPFQADLDSRIAEEARAAAQVTLAEIELKRIHDMPAGASVPIELQRVEAALAEARAVLAGAKAAVESARLLVEWCRVTAPISGRIGERLVDPGNLITGGIGTATLLTTIASIDPIYCYIDADEHAVLKYQRLAREQKRVSARDARIPFFMQLADETTFAREGVVDFVDNRIDPATGTILGRGVLPNPGGYLTPGFFARVRIPGSGTYVATMVPDSAVISDQNQKVLYVVGPGDTVEARPVRLGAVLGKLRAIESGIDTGDRVIINGLMQARPGAKVNPQEGSISLESLPPVPDRPQPPDSTLDGAPEPAVKEESAP
jgi:multidrug efflux system membrane fusion protein